jgi:hemerythrin
MKPIVWTPALSMGDPEVDRQHRHFIDQVNDLSAAASHADKRALVRLTEEIAADAFTHFAYEDDLLLRLNYPDAEEHSAEHRRLEEKIDGMLPVLATADDTPRAAETIACRIRDLLLDHLLYYDLKYKSLLDYKKQLRIFTPSA